jgi:hypothetical protein
VTGREPKFFQISDVQELGLLRSFGCVSRLIEVLRPRFVIDNGKDEQAILLPMPRNVIADRLLDRGWWMAGRRCGRVICLPFNPPFGLIKQEPNV